MLREKALPLAGIWLANQRCLMSDGDARLVVLKWADRAIVVL